MIITFVLLLFLNVVYVYNHLQTKLCFSQHLEKRNKWKNDDNEKFQIMIINVILKSSFEQNFDFKNAF